ncbi:MAG: hypothetical protein Q9228_007270 [Teloschistes exilis]
MAQGKVLVGHPISSITLDTDSFLQITGASGFIGFRTLVSALGAGYPVLAAVPSKEKADLIRSAPSVKHMNPGPKLTFVTIPDIVADNALADIVKTDIEYIIHAASPNIDHITASNQFDAQIIHPVVKSTSNILSAALKNPHVKRVVMTSSEGALIPYMELYQLASFNTFTDASPIPTPMTPYPTAMAALCAAQSQALTATNSFLAKNKPHFTVVTLMPSITLGRNDLASTSKDLLEGGNLQALRHLRGDKVSSNVPSTTVHIEDVAKVHVASLDTQKIEKTQNFMLNSDSLWYEAKDVVKKHYMDDVKKGWLSLEGEQPVNAVHLDSTRTQKVFGTKFIGFEKQINDLVGQYVELKAKEAKK